MLGYGMYVSGERRLELTPCLCLGDAVCFRLHDKWTEISIMHYMHPSAYIISRLHDKWTATEINATLLMCLRRNYSPFSIKLYW